MLARLDQTETLLSADVEPDGDLQCCGGGGPQPGVGEDYGETVPSDFSPGWDLPVLVTAAQSPD